MPTQFAGTRMPSAADRCVSPGEALAREQAAAIREVLAWIARNRESDKRRPASRRYLTRSLPLGPEATSHYQAPRPNPRRRRFAWSPAGGTRDTGIPCIPSDLQKHSLARVPIACADTGSAAPAGRFTCAARNPAPVRSLQGQPPRSASYGPRPCRQAPGHEVASPLPEHGTLQNRDDPPPPL
jgi:hypothetical protein